MTPFETRMIEDMKLFGYSKRTQDTYLYAVRKLCAHVHTLRHSYATHLLEEGINIRIISEYLGHKSLDSTLVYTHLTPLMRQGVADKINQVMAGVQ